MRRAPMIVGVRSRRSFLKGLRTKGGRLRELSGRRLQGVAARGALVFYVVVGVHASAAAGSANPANR